MATVTSSKRQQTHTSNTYESNSTITAGDLPTSTSDTNAIVESSGLLKKRALNNVAFAGIGSGTVNKLPLWDSTSSLTSSVITQSNNNIGIGTASPQGKLDINTEDAEPTHVYINGEVNQNKLLYFRHYANSEAAANNVALGYIGSNGIDNLLSLGHLNSSGTDVPIMHLTEAGNVGIGTTAPSDKLHVVQNTDLNTALFQNTFGRAQVIIDSQSTAHNSYLSLSNGGSEFAFLDAKESANLLRIATNITGAEIAIETNSQDEAVRIDSSGNVGIGTTNPSKKLDVRGDIRIDGSITQYSTAANSTVLNRFWNNTGGVLLAELALYDFGTSLLGGQLSFGEGISKYATLRGTNTDGGKLTLETTSSSANVIINGNGDTVFNETGAAFDFRIEGDIDPNLFFVDGSADKIGIGTADPRGKLHVSTTGNYTEAIVSSVVNATSGSYLRLTEGANDWGTYGYLGGYIQYDGNDNLIIIGRHDTNGTTLTDDIPVITIKRDDGRVGVGITNPSNPLHVVSGDNVLATFESTDANATLYLKDSNTTLSSTFKRITNDLAILESGGNVGINTTTPTSKLQIIGAASGDSVLKVDGTNGTLFEVVDDLSDSLMSVNDAAGLPVFEVFADNTIVGGRYNQNDFYLNTNGCVGIGTDSPSSRLHLVSNVAVGNIFEIDNQAGNQVLNVFQASTLTSLNMFDQNGASRCSLTASSTLGGGISLFETSGATYFTSFASVGTVFNESGSAVDFRIEGNTDANLFFVDGSTDRIGIGTNAPAQLLHVYGVTQLGAAGKTEGGAVLNYASFGETKSSASTILGNAIVPGTANSTVQRSKSDAGNFVRLKYNTGICFHTNVTSTINTNTAETTNERVRIDLTGNLLISDGLVGAPSLSFINDTNTGMWRPGSDQLRLVTGGSDAIVINSSQAIQLPDYGSGNNTGTRAYFLAVDSAGNIIEDSGGGGGTIGDGTITLAAGTGLTGGGSFTTNQSSNATITFNATGSGSGTVSEVTVNTGLSVTNGTTTPDISLVLTDLPDMTENWDTNNDEFIVLDSGTDQKRKLSSEIFGSNAFNSTTIPTDNNQLTNGANYSTTTGTVTGTGTIGYITKWDTTTAIENSSIFENTSGSIGIGTITNITQKLQINGNLRVIGAFYDSNNSAGTSGQILSSTVSGTAWITGGGGTGTVTGTGTAGYISKWDNTSAIENSSVFQNTNGNVGIGTTANLSQKLRVEGDLRVTGGIYDSSGDVGSNGQILSSTASGTNWTDAGTGTVISVSTGGTVNGLTLSGGPITGSGTITLGGTLGNIANTALANDSITINGTSTALGGSIDAIPTGGTTSQVLAKSSNTDYAVGWTSAGSGTITGVTAGTGLNGGGTSGVVTVNIDGDVCQGIKIGIATAVPNENLFEFVGIGITITKTASNKIQFDTSGSSDYRLKKNVSIFTSECWQKIKEVDVRKFDFDEEIFESEIKSDHPQFSCLPDSMKDNIGFFAHELEVIGLTAAVTGEKDAIDEDGNPVYQKVNFNPLIPVLWGALKDAISKIETLEEKVKTLENKE
jgi:fibronectin-binding autotransporter adhesin